MRVKRRWGWYLTLLRLPFFCIKILKFDAGEMLSNQRHRWRNEFWIILKGFGDAQIDGEWTPKPAPAVYMINAMQWHVFHAHVDTWVLEFQFGKQCKEEDIERK